MAQNLDTHRIPSILSRDIVYSIVAKQKFLYCFLYLTTNTILQTATIYVILKDKCFIHIYTQGKIWKIQMYRSTITI